MERSEQGTANNETDPLIDNSSCAADACTDSVEIRAFPMRGRGGLKVVLLILVTNMFECLTSFSILAGVLLFCTSSLSINQVDATSINQVFSGFVFVMPVLGGFIADSYLGRYRTVYSSGILYITGLLLLPASAVNYSDWGWTDATLTQRKALFFTSLVLICLGTGGVKSTLGPFGAQQIESRGEKAVESFFNWFYWMINVGGTIGVTLVAYVQQEISFVWGFFIPTISLTVGLLIFMAGQSKYKKTAPEGSILTTAFGIFKQGACRTRPEPNIALPEGSERKMLARSKKSFGGSFDDHLVDGITCVIRVAPFCAFMVMFWALNAQMNNTFFAQAERMDVRLGGGVNVPAAAISAFNGIGIIILIPAVNRVIYPFFDRIGYQLSQLKKMGIGLVLAAVGMIVAGIVEIYRKKVLHSEGGSHVQVLAGETFTASNMSAFVLVPQYVLIGLSEIFASITAMEFVYSQTPLAMQGLTTGLFYASIGIGNWVSSAILAIVEGTTRNDPWWSSDINNAKMENLMFLLAGLMLVNVAGFCAVAHFYTYQDPSRFEASVCGQNKDISVEQNRELDDCTEEEERATNSGSNEAKGTDRLAALV